MAEKGSTGYSINLRYRDLASEVMRRRITMTRRYPPGSAVGAGMEHTC